MHPTVKPDLTKLLRAVEDALTGVVWRDDSQIIHQVVNKEYADVDMTSVFIQLL
jgi:Holliday junction resolvase RusA-like endonuclease